MLLELINKCKVGMPCAALVVLAGTRAINIIPEAVLALLLGIDPIPDIGRASMNVEGNSVATATVGKWENVLKD